MFKNVVGNLVYLQKTLVIRFCFETAVSPKVLKIITTSMFKKKGEGGCLLLGRASPMEPSKNY